MSQKLFVAALYATKRTVYGRTINSDVALDVRYSLSASEQAAKSDALATLKHLYPPILGWKNHAVVLREVPNEIIEQVRSIRENAS